MNIKVDRMITDDEKTDRFRKFFLENFPKVKAFALKLLKSEDDAEDIAQDIFVKLWAHPELWIEREKWDGYLFSMLRNHIYNFLEHKSVEAHYIENVTEDIQFSLSDMDDTVNKLYAKEINILLKMTIEQMSAQRRRIFLLSRHQGLSNQEIADELHLSIRTVEHHLYLALRELKKNILIFLIFSLSSL